jgi:SSS family solute:Na+ symporter
VTPADFVRGRYGSRGLALAVAATGILATMPYVALQLVGIQAVLTVLGVGGSATSTFVKDLPLLIAFLLLAAFTYLSGLRAPALIAFVKDLLIYVMIIVAVSYIPSKLGGWGHIFSVAGTHLAKTNPKTGKPFGALTVAPAGEWAYATLALGSALALFMYPHAVTGVLAAKRRNVIRRNMAILPAYSLVLGLVALLGYMALAAPGVPAEVKAHGANAQLSVPFLFQKMFPSWFAGVGYSAIAIGALVPAAIMSIAAANLFTRNIFKEFFKPNASPKLETRVAQFASLLVKVGALIFVLALSPKFSINLQLLGGIWILQTFPAIVIGLYTRWFHRWALVIGWVAAMAYGTIVAYNTPAPGEPGSHFGASTANVAGLNHTVYIAVTALVINLVLAAVLTVVFRLLRLPAGSDETTPAHYVAGADEATPEPEPLPAAAAGAT